MDLTPISAMGFVVAAVGVMRLAALADASLRVGKGGAEAGTGPGSVFEESGDWAARAYWDPLPTARSLTDSIGNGRWEDRSWLNVPGPFYTGATGATGVGPSGPESAPRHVLSGDGTTEFVYRQPRTPHEVYTLVGTAGYEPLAGYAWDGDEHWTPAAVREWWAGRARVRAWIRGELAAPTTSVNARSSLREFAGHLDEGLEDYLRGYVFWLIAGREPGRGEALPAL
ncbi:ferredoxin [Embleya sp. NBC_00896]|uniref:ferredoxin n=1 Tax=Embleya sp. NBC_00896 TaxID=2975961 RepID=UPI002F91815C|nr:ferredoxin [Embleya sp. NBC_00896]